MVGREQHARAFGGEPADELHSRSRWPGSSAEEGSSSASTGGSAISPSATFTRWRLPPERRSTRSWRALAQPRLLEHPLDRRVRVGDPLQAREQAQVLGDRQLRVERRLLRRPADFARGPADAVRRSGAGRRRGSTAASSCRRRWGRRPRPARPRRLEADVAQRLALAVALAETADAEQPATAHAHSSPRSAIDPSGSSVRWRRQVDDRLAQDREDRQRDQRADDPVAAAPRAAARRSRAAG